MGPFIDAEHPTVKSGADIVVEGKPKTYTDLWLDSACVGAPG